MNRRAFFKFGSLFVGAASVAPQIFIPKFEPVRWKKSVQAVSVQMHSLGTFDKWIFPIIANMPENDVIDQLVALQPMASPVSQIVYTSSLDGAKAAQMRRYNFQLDVG
jgi:hypothetical protein